MNFVAQSILAQSGAPAVQGVVPDVAWSLLHPGLILVEGAVVMITLTAVIPFLRRNGWPAAITILLASVSFWRIGPIWQRVSEEGPQAVVGRAIVIDHFTLFIWGVIAVSVFIVAALLDGYLRREGLDGPEWYVLILLSAVGGMLMAASQDLILTFVGLEILSIAVYVLAGLHLRRTESQEAAFKYFLLGALGSALLLYGIALVYGATGSTSLEVIAGARSPVANGLNPLEDSSLILGGMALILVGFGFKVSAVPFHAWTPDVYEGSPTPVVAFMASAVKVAGFAGLVRVFWQGFGYYLEDWRYPVIVMASLSLIVGSLMALPQTNAKRMLAFSSIAHAGFMLIAVQALASGDPSISLLGAQSLLYYLMAYSVMVAGTFGAMSLIGAGESGRGDGAHSLDDYAGLAQRRPLLAGLLAVLLFAQAGIPFTSGFLAKFQVIVAAVDSGATVLAGVAMLSAVVAAVLYLRIVVSMFMVDSPSVALAVDDTALADSDHGDSDQGAVESGLGGRSGIPMAWPAVTVIAMAAIASIVLGVMPIAEDGFLTEAAQALVELRR